MGRPASGVVARPAHDGHTSVMTPRLLIASMAVDAGALWLVGAVLSWDTDPVSGTSRILWLIGLAVFGVAAGLAGYQLVTDAPAPLRATVVVASAGLAVTVALAPATGLDPSAQLMLIEGIVAAVVGAVGLVVAAASRRRSLV